MKSSFLYIICMIIFIRCSSVTAYWYSEPEDKFFYRDEKSERISARAVTEKAVFEVWSASSEHPVLSGPMLIPFYSVEPPVLNSEQLKLVFEFSSLKEKTNFNGKIMKESLKLRLNDSEDVYPDLAVLYEKNQNGIYEIRKSYSGTPEYIPFNGDAYVEMTFFSAVYSELKQYSFQPALRLKSSDAECPLLKFRPERKRTYIPFRFPFSLPIK